MFGQEKLEQLRQQKQALILESQLHRLQFQAEVQNLRAASAWWVELSRAPQRLSPLLLVLAPLAGFLLARRFRNPAPSRLLTLAKWLIPLYRLWRSLSRRQQEHSEAQAPSPCP